jgi:hypothetical protein
MPPMRRLRLAVTAVTVAASAAAASAVAAPAGPTAPLPSLFAHEIHTINAAAHAPAVLLPRSMPLDAKHLYAAGGPSGNSYDLSIGAVAHCGGADACFVAAFGAVPSTKVFGRRVTVRGATRAAFEPLSCGASCSPPQIDFIVHGVRYTIQANLRTKQTDRAALIAAAQSAISAGPR